MTAFRLPVATDWILPALLVAAVLLGGATQEGFAGAALLELAGLASIAFARGGSAELAAKRLHGLFVLAGIFVLIELLPLPGALWSRLPGRGGVAADYGLMATTLPALGLSLDRFATIGSALMLLVAGGAAMLTIRADDRIRRRAMMAIVAIASVSVCLGALQVAGGSESRFYPYHNTNHGSAVGFFANTNHLGTLLLMALPFSAALARRGSRRRKRFGRAGVQLALALFLSLGVALNRSVAGLGLLAPVAIASLLVYRSAIGRPTRMRYAIAAAGLIVVFDLFMALGPYNHLLVDKAMNVADPTMRHTSVSVTWQAARTFLPFGSGLGTFVHIYPMFEDPTRISRTFVNHAHNEYVELLLETGVFGIALFGLFCLWFADRVRVVWRESGASAAPAQAATVAIATVLLHAVVDYPTRTGAILAVLGFALGLLAVPVPTIADERAADATSEPRKGRHLIIE